MPRCRGQFPAAGGIATAIDRDRPADGADQACYPSFMQLA